MSAWLRGLRVKLLILVFVPVLTILGMGALAFYSVNLLHKEVVEIGEEHMPQATSLGNFAEGLQGMMRSFWALYGSERNVELREKYKARTDRFRGQIDKAIADFEAIQMDDAEKADWAKIKDAWLKADPTIKAIEAKFAKNTAQDDIDAKRTMFDVLRPQLAPVEEGLDDLISDQIKDGKAMAASADQFGERILVGLEISVPIIVAVIAAFGIFLAWKLSSRLSQIVGHISNSADEVGMASQQLSDASHKLSSGASEAAASLEETVASLEELSSMVKQNADNSNQAGSLSQSARSSAEEGEGEVRHLITAMGEISTSSKKIEEIINVIDDIAFQTNLLALNAAVEAARAGDQGRGFAVVAEAVRTLAQRSSDAAKDINNLIKDSVEKVGKGATIADRSGEVLKKIVVNSKKVADLTNEIAAASQEQATGIAQISKAMNQLDQATQSNAASAEETASTSQQLSAEADGLRRQVTDLVEVVDGTRDAVTRESNETRSFKPSPHAATPPAKSKPAAHDLKPKAVKASAGSSSAKDAIPFGDDDDFGSVSGF